MADPSQQKLREFISAHISVRKLQEELKAAKSLRKALEQEITPDLAKQDIQQIDVDDYRFYRYGQRIVPYHLVNSK